MFSIATERFSMTAHALTDPVDGSRHIGKLLGVVLSENRFVFNGDPGQ
jgi:hypothetical protein